MEPPEGAADTTLTDQEKRGRRADERLPHFRQTLCIRARNQTQHHWARSVQQPNCLACLVPTLTYYKDHTMSHNNHRCGKNFLDWVNDSLPLDTILEFVSLYWFTKSFPRAIYPYREVGPLLDRLAKILILMIL